MQTNDATGHALERAIMVDHLCRARTLPHVAVPQPVPERRWPTAPRGRPRRYTVAWPARRAGWIGLLRTLARARRYGAVLSVEFGEGE